MLRNIIVTTAVVAATIAPITAAAASITPARGTWDTEWFNTQIYIEALKALGHEVTAPITLDDAVRYQALDEGDADFSVMEWFPLFNQRLANLDNIEQAGYVIRGGALEGYLIDKATAEAHGITNIADLADPDIAALFDRTGDGTADMVACPPGWDCGLVIEHHLEAFELTDSISLITAAYEPAMADAIAAYEAGEPILFYTWTPNWVLGELVPGEDVVWLEVPYSTLPAGQEDHIGETSVSGLTACSNDPCEIGFPANDIRPVANVEFLEANPDVRRLFEVMELPLEAVAAQNVLMRAGEDSDADIERHAQEWIAENQELFDGWIAEARTAMQ